MSEHFNCEHSMFLTLQDGSRQFDLRRWDIGDERFYRLAWWSDPTTAQARVPEVQTVSFADKDTGEIITLEYKGLVFVPWATGWVFLLLGKPIEVPEGTGGNDD